jgi:hypothetical protein
MEEKQEHHRLSVLIMAFIITLATLTRNWSAIWAWYADHRILVIAAGLCLLGLLVVVIILIRMIMVPVHHYKK